MVLRPGNESRNAAPSLVAPPAAASVAKPALEPTPWWIIILRERLHMMLLYVEWRSGDKLYRVFKSMDDFVLICDTAYAPPTVRRVVCGTKLAWVITEPRHPDQVFNTEPTGMQVMCAEVAGTLLMDLREAKPVVW